MSTDAVATVDPPAVDPPRNALPEGACDAHSHIFGPFDLYPPREKSIYALPLAPPAIHARMRLQLGVRFGLLTQPAPYGDDPSAMLHAISADPEALRGIAVARPGVSEETLNDWKDRGISGLRFTEMQTPDGGRYPGSATFEDLLELAPSMRAAGLHAQLWATTRQLVEWLPRLVDLNLTLVLDHMACPDTAEGTNGAFSDLLSVVRTRDLWVKLAVCRVSKSPPAYDDARPFHDALVDAAPSRMLWGSDWPYVRMAPAPNAGLLADLFTSWTPDTAIRHAILVDNPRNLYRFDRRIL